MSDIEAEAAPGVWLVHRLLAGDVLWFWQCRVCPDSFGPLTSREGAEVGARAHGHRDDYEECGQDDRRPSARRP